MEPKTEPPKPPEPINRNDPTLLAATRTIKEMVNFPADENEPPYEFSLDESRDAMAESITGPVKLRYARKIGRIFPTEKDDWTGFKDMISEDTLIVWTRKKDNPHARDVIIVRRLGEMPRMSVHDRNGVTFYQMSPITGEAGQVMGREWKKTYTLGHPFEEEDPVEYAFKLVNGIDLGKLVPANQPKTAETSDTSAVATA